jgi:hypothetical protein
MSKLKLLPITMAAHLTSPPDVPYKTSKSKSLSEKLTIGPHYLPDSLGAARRGKERDFQTPFTRKSDSVDSDTPNFDG